MLSVDTRINSTKRFDVNLSGGHLVVRREESIDRLVDYILDHEEKPDDNLFYSLATPQDGMKSFAVYDQLHIGPQTGPELLALDDTMETIMEDIDSYLSDQQASAAPQAPAAVPSGQTSYAPSLISSPAAAPTSASLSTPVIDLESHMSKSNPLFQMAHADFESSDEMANQMTIMPILTSAGVGDYSQSYSYGTSTSSTYSMTSTHSLTSSVAEPLAASQLPTTIAYSVGSPGSASYPTPSSTPSFIELKPRSDSSPAILMPTVISDHFQRNAPSPGPSTSMTHLPGPCASPAMSTSSYTSTSTVDTKEFMKGLMNGELMSSSSRGPVDDDRKYLCLRKKNNQASKKSRQTKREKFLEMSKKAVDLEKDNQRLAKEAEKMEQAISQLKTYLMEVMRNGGPRSS